jgi:hypothetical protein
MYIGVGTRSVPRPPFNREKAGMGREDYILMQGGKLRSGMLVLDIDGRAKKGSLRGAVPEGVGVVEEITKIEPASPSGGKEYVDLHLKEMKRGTKRKRYACKTKLFRAKPTA